MQNRAKTKTHETQRQYQRVLHALDRTAERMVSDGVMTTWPETQVRLVIAYLHVEPSLAEASARMYCAALGWMLSDDHSDAGFDARVLLFPEPGPDLMEREDQIKNLRRSNARLFPRGAQQKAKSLSRVDREALIEALLANRTSSYATPAALWFQAGTLTGLRPGEWQSAEITTANQLTLLNAKFSNGRSFGATRTQELKLLSELDLTIIRCHLANVKNASASAGYNAFYNGCRDILRRTSDLIWPGRTRHPSLYTARHLFAADAKSTFSKTVVAALLGHGSTESAARHYAHSRTGSGNLQVEPLPADVQAVRSKLGLTSPPVADENAPR
jgi:hypothetical protein